jgi:hypothetical protein
MHGPVSADGEHGRPSYVRNLFLQLPTLEYEPISLTQRTDVVVVFS